MRDDEYKQMMDHLVGFPDRQREVREMREVVFGNPRTGEMGMKQKVDEIHQILVQAKGLKGVLYILIAIGGAIAVLKGFILK